MPKPGDEEYETAYQLGRILGSSGYSVCTGGYQGIMDAVSRGAAEFGQEAIGITVDIFQSLPSKFLTNEIKCASLLERIELLLSLGNAYIILRGGTGTLVELSLVWEYLNKGLMDHKPAAAHGKMWFNIIEEMEMRISFEKRKMGMIKSFLQIDKCADYIITQLEV